MTVTTYKNLDDLPLVLTVDQVAEVLKICRKVAYQLVKEEGLAIRVGEKRLVIPKDRLLNYLMKKENLFFDVNK
jgi:excisionase family DNA binding protein